MHTFSTVNTSQFDMSNPYIQQEEQYGAHNYAPSPVVLARGQGFYVWDEQGNRYIDMMSAYSAVSHGHCHPKIIEVLKQQASTLNIVSRSFYTDKLGSFLKRLCSLTGYEQALIMNTGAEAVETALKAAVLGVIAFARASTSPYGTVLKPGVKGPKPALYWSKVDILIMEMVRP